MLIRFFVTRKDTGAGVPNARIEVEKAETVGFTDSQGKAELITFWSGNFAYSVSAPGYGYVSGTVDNRDIPVLNFGVSLLYSAKSTTPNPGPSEETVGRIGTSCSIIRNTAFDRSFFQIRHDRSGNITSLHSDLQEVKGQGERTPACFETPPPPPKTTDELGSEVSTLQKLLNSTVGKIENLTQGIGDIISKAAEEAQAWRKGILDLEARMKAWFEEQILMLLLKNLNAAAKEYRSRK